MSEKAFEMIVFMVLLNGMLTLAFNIQMAGTPGTIYTRADGLVELSTMSILIFRNSPILP